MALRRIALRDFVIVQALELDLQDGFSVLTGETGAGKSILIDAIQLQLGARADSGLIREGAARTDISAEFDTCPTALTGWLQEAGLDSADNLLLRRTLDTQGKSRAWINGIPATAAQLRSVGEHLIDIHGQHAWQSLTRPDAVRGLLDAYAGLSTHALAGLWSAWRAAQQALEQAQAAQHTLQQERERLLWQIAELDKLNPGADEWDDLNAQQARLSHAQGLLESAQGALALLQENESQSALSTLSRARSMLQNYEQIDPQFRALVEVLDTCLSQASDVAHSLQAYSRHADPDPQLLSQLDNRIAQWLSLARRYKCTPADLPTLLGGWRHHLAQLDQASDLDSLQASERQHAKAYEQAARKLSQQRSQAAPQLAQAISGAMQGLGMTGGRFEVQIQPTDAGPQGRDAVSFLVSSHPGMTPRPVGKVASGGELSRIALAISVTTSELGEAPTLIFDEVDSGVGGAVAHTVGQLMQQLGQARQVLAVTHLPQVAACASQHLRVAKHQTGGQTASQVLPIQGQARLEELARMLGGQSLSAATLAHARELLEQSQAAIASV